MAKQTESKDNIAKKVKDRYREAIVLGGFFVFVFSEEPPGMCM